MLMSASERQERTGRGNSKNNKRSFHSHGTEDVAESQRLKVIAEPRDDLRRTGLQRLVDASPYPHHLPRTRADTRPCCVHSLVRFFSVAIRARGGSN